MHKKYNYSSVFSTHLNEYISSRRELGFKYDNPAYWLYRFDQFCVQKQTKEMQISKSLYDEWASKSDNETKTTQNNRLQAVRNFSKYLNTIGIKSYVPKNLPKPEKIVPYLMTDGDITAFFQQVDKNESASPYKTFDRMAQEYKVLFRLIYCCGLRNNEAASLKTSDFNASDGSITVHHAKGNKERIVYLSDDMKELCIKYQKWLNKRIKTTSVWFFPGMSPETHIPKTSIDKKFNQFWNATGLSNQCDKKPTVHCLRHAFVIKRVNLWMENDISLQAMMPY